MNLLGIFTSISGRVCGHYEMGGRIGTGAMGDVYKARDVHLDRLVAIKVLSQWARGDPAARVRFKNEAKAASALNHPNIVTVHEIFEHEGIDLLVMEYLPGETLHTAIPRLGWAFPEALQRATELANALAVAHAAGILHGDLKPGNVLMAADGRCKLGDFGLAEMLQSAPMREADPTRKPGGTRAYMAPEQLDGGKSDPRSEIFSFGMILHQMVSGRYPFEVDSRADIALALRTQEPVALPEATPGNLAQVVAQCLNKNPARRYPSMQDVVANLLLCARGGDEAWNARKPRRDPPIDSQFRRLIRRVHYDSLSDARSALAEIRRQMEAGLPAAASDHLVAHLKSIITRAPDARSGVVPNAVREIRRLVLDALRNAVEGELTRCFAPHDLETLDLYGVDFSDCVMNGLSVRQCFLATASMAHADLSGATLSGAWIRNVDFHQANTTDADFTDADWFNAANLTETQLLAIRRGTLAPCPANVAEMHRSLKVRYGFPFDSWAASVRNQLTSTWATYLRPGGLRDVVARL